MPAPLLQSVRAVYRHAGRSRSPDRPLDLPRTSLLLAALMFATGTASAQRADTTAASEADDAFGLSVAGETIGLYSDKYVRGFSPVNAGNLRLDGLYIDRQGEFTDDFEVPDPAQFGLPTEDDGTRSDPLLSGVSNAVTAYRPDVDALQAAPTRVVVAAGMESHGTLTWRTAAGTAELLRLHDPGQVRSAVASPGGSTEAGLEALEAEGARGAFEAAVRAWLERMAP